MADNASGASTPQPPAVRLERVSRQFGSDFAVRDVDLEVAEGELICLLGASGSGKTTMLRMIAGFDAPTSGAIYLGDRDVSSLSPSRREIGMVFQNYALFPTLTVAKNVEYGLKMRGWKGRDRAKRVEEMLERMHLQRFAKRYPAQLSGGQQQRVAIARALAYSPRLVLMDEPLGALDKALKQDMLGEIREVHREFGATILYVTHDREEALTLADRVAIMRDSRLVTCEPVEQLYLTPPTAYAAEFFSGANVLSVETAASPSGGTRVTFAGQSLELPTPPPERSVVASVRPRDIRVGTGTEGWRLSAVVVDRIFLGDDVLVKVELPGRPDEHLSAQLPLAAAGAAATVGSELDLVIDPSAVHLLPDDRVSS